MKFSNLKYTILVSFTIFFISCSNKKTNYEQKVEPPIAASDIAWSLFTFKQDTAITIHTSKGSIIKIHPNTFIHTNGSAVTNQIVVKFREMHTALEIFKSGIPMSIDSSRGSFLQSGGMLEIRAFDNKEELTIANGKSIGVELASFKPADGYSLFHLNDNKSWNVLDTFTTIKNDRKVSALNEILSFISRPFVPNHSNTNNVFEIVANLQEAPHVKPFVKQKWKILEGTDPSALENYMRVSWDDVVIKRQSKTSNVYNLTFTKTYTTEGVGEQTKSITLKASPVLLGLNDSIYNFSELAFNKQIEAYEQSLKLMKEEEVRIKAEADMISSFRIKQMGIWNIDKVLKMNDLVTVSLNFDFEKQLDPIINKIKLFVLHEDDNSVIYYLPSDWKNVRLSKTRRNSLVAVLPGNKTAVVNASEVIAKLQTGGSSFDFNTKIENFTGIRN
jgi:hypothetical protein